MCAIYLQLLPVNGDTDESRFVCKPINRLNHPDSSMRLRQWGTIALCEELTMRRSRRTALEDSALLVPTTPTARPQAKQRPTRQTLLMIPAKCGLYYGAFCWSVLSTEGIYIAQRVFIDRRFLDLFIVDEGAVD
jgi:hypothetical protein